jgi:hypothetical protein
MRSGNFDDDARAYAASVRVTMLYVASMSVFHDVYQFRISMTVFEETDEIEI